MTITLFDSRIYIIIIIIFPTHISYIFIIHETIGLGSSYMCLYFTIYLYILEKVSSHNYYKSLINEMSARIHIYIVVTNSYMHVCYCTFLICAHHPNMYIYI